MTSAPRADHLATGHVATRSVDGLILCGGRSRRMGADKARIPLAGRTLLEHAVGIVAARAERIWLACGAEARYAELGLPLAIDRAADLGPLAGLEAGLAAVRADREAGGGRPDAWVLVLACDMPDADPGLFDALLARADARDLDACLFESARGPEPLYGVYHTRLLPAIRTALDSGAAQATSFARYPVVSGASGRLPRIESLTEAEIAPALRAPDVAANLNTPEDLARARTLRTAAIQSGPQEKTA